MLIFESDEYKSMLQEQMENDAREWFKKKKEKINDTIKSETVII